PEELLFDCNELAKGKPYFQLGGMSISPDNKLATFAIDIVGRRIYTIGIKNLQTGEILADTIENVTGSSVWANDNETVFYSKQDSKTLRSDKVYKHKLGKDVKEDVLIYFEKDGTYNVEISKSKSKKSL